MIAARHSPAAYGAVNGWCRWRFGGSASSRKKEPPAPQTGAGGVLRTTLAPLAQEQAFGSLSLRAGWLPGAGMFGLVLRSAEP